MRSGSAMTPLYGAKMAAPRARGGLERAELIGFMGRDPDPIES